MRSGVFVLGLFLAVPGCGFQSQMGPADSMGVDDVGPCRTFASQFDTCGLALDVDLELKDALAFTYNTSTGELRAEGAAAASPVKRASLMTLETPVDAIVADTVRLHAGVRLRARGTLGFAIVARRIILESNAAIDVSDGGAGVLARCPSPAMEGRARSGGGSGGGGGGFSTSGGDGGPGDADGELVPGGTRASSIQLPRGPQGGCPGARGGAGNSPGGAGGAGGGAIYLVAEERIEIGAQAAVLANGGGGRGGPHGDRDPPSGNAGGGGGGAGGMIVLEAPQIIASQSVVVANGGGGGGGSTSSQPGRDGQAGRATTERALGGAGSDEPLDASGGGAGGSLADTAGESALAANSGGGGGGGGVGYIVIVSPDAQLGTLSPQRAASPE